MYIFYNGWGIPYLMPSWLAEGLAPYAIIMISDCEWLIPGTYNEL